MKDTRAPFSWKTQEVDRGLLAFNDSPLVCFEFFCLLDPDPMAVSFRISLGSGILGLQSCFEGCITYIRAHWGDNANEVMVKQQVVRATAVRKCLSTTCLYPVWNKHPQKGCVWAQASPCQVPSLCFNFLACIPWPLRSSWNPEIPWLLGFDWKLKRIFSSDFSYASFTGTCA